MSQVKIISCPQLREYKLQQNYETAATTSAPEPPEVTEIIARSNEKTKKFQYKIVDADAETAVTKEVARNGNDIIEFIPVERRVKKVKDFEIATNEVNPEAVSVSSPSFSLKKNQLKLLGSGAKPSKVELSVSLRELSQCQSTEKALLIVLSQLRIC